MGFNQSKKQLTARQLTISHHRKWFNCERPGIWIENYVGFFDFYRQTFVLLISGVRVVYDMVGTFLNSNLTPIEVDLSEII